MRDIRQDLRERLEAKRQQRIRHELALEQCDAAIRSYEALLAEEEARVAAPMLHATALGPLAPNGATRPTPTLSLDDFIVKAVGEGVTTKDEIRDRAVAAGYFQGAESPGRVIHAKVLHLCNSMRLYQLEDGKLAVVQTASEALGLRKTEGAQ